MACKLLKAKRPAWAMHITVRLSDILRRFYPSVFPLRSPFLKLRAPKVELRMLPCGVLLKFLSNESPDVRIFCYGVIWKLHKTGRPDMECKLLKAKRPARAMHIIVRLSDILRRFYPSVCPLRSPQSPALPASAQVSVPCAPRLKCLSPALSCALRSPTRVSCAPPVFPMSSA